MAYRREIWFTKCFAWIFLTAFFTGSTCGLFAAWINNPIFQISTLGFLLGSVQGFWIALTWSLILPFVVDAGKARTVIWGMFLPIAASLLTVPAFFIVGFHVLVSWYLYFPGGAFVGLSTWYILSRRP